MNLEEYTKKCYLLARNEKEYLQDGSFNARVEELLLNIEPEDQKDAVSILEQMITYKDAYYEAEKSYCPILLYKSEPICYGILNHFADCMKYELEQLGETVEVFDAAKQPLEEMISFSKKKYKAVLGIQTYLFSVRLINNEYLHDHFTAPLYNMILDHPIVMHRHLMNAPHNMVLLTHDRNYKAFIEKYYKDKVFCELLAPGGEAGSPGVDKIYEISFAGTYRNWRQWVEEIKILNRKYPRKIRRLIYELKHNPDKTYEECVWQIFGDQSAEQIFECKSTYFCVMNYYREKILDMLCTAGIELHVFGESWKISKYVNCPGIIMHDELDQKEILDVYAKSKISLNIMSWHKDGMTERVANMMLSKTVALSDWSRYLDEEFIDGEEIVLFRLADLERLPSIIWRLLEDDEMRTRIAQKGYEKALEHHTWKKRAEKFLEIVQEHGGI